jgi:hypothetical protein
MMRGVVQRWPDATEGEALLFRLIALRRAGNVWEDNDRILQAAAVRHEIIE